MLAKSVSIPVLSLVFTLSVSAILSAQQYSPAAGPGGPSYYTSTPDLSQQFATLTDQPATHTSFALDRNTLQAAQGILEANGVDARRAAAAITGVSFDMYHYHQPAFYTPEAMSAVIAQYIRAGWKHLVNGNQTVANAAQPKSAITDLWLHFSGADIDGVTVLTRSAKEMNVIRVSGDLRPLDLLHLGGHFGIPKVDPSAVMVPAPPGR